MIKPPKMLGLESKKIWTQINNEFELDSSALILLQTALEAYGRYLQAKKIIDKTGIVFKTKSGQAKPNPALKIETLARAGFLQAWKMLNLDIALPGGIGRPTD